jgi:protein involved in polysaccharide export with SLBB domain
MSLYASLNIAQMQSALEANPDLLNTPEAQAMMRQKGINASDIKARLNKNKKLDTKVIDSSDIENKIDVVDANESNTSLSMLSTHRVDTKKIDDEKSIRLNPFAYKTSEELRKELRLKQQTLIQSKLARYSSSFYTNKNTIDLKSLPTPEDYIISTGDALNILIYGDRNVEYDLDVKNDGSVNLEYIGPVKVAGMTYKEAKEHLKSKLKKHFPLSSFDISISKYSSIQVTLVGDVKHPGLYNLSSFSTVKDLLIASKGVRKSASVRNITIKRDSQIVGQLDLYALLFKGEKIKNSLLKQGDVVVVHKAKKLVSIDGYVNHAAIFELKKGETLAKLIAYAGGMKAKASKSNIKVERYSENAIKQSFNLAYTQAKNFKMQDGDRVYIYPLDFSANKSVNIYGNVIRPGSYNIAHQGTLNELLNKQLIHGLNKFFLPETCFKYAIIKRYSPSLNYVIKSFNLRKVMQGKEYVALQPQDEIYIFSQNDIYASSYVTTNGKILIKPGKLKYFQGMTISDAINASGVDGIIDDRVRVTTINTKDRMPQTKFYSLKQEGNTLLYPFDDIEVYDYYKTHILSPVTIKGEVVNPTTVFYEKGMTLYKLLNVAGGLTPKAYKNDIEIVRYYINDKNMRTNKNIHINLAKINPKTYMINKYDEVTVHKIPNWGEKKTISIKGEVKFPGVYTIETGEKLEDVLKRAGGFTKDAFVQGAILTRESIRKNQITQYNSSLARLKRELAIFNAMPANSKNSLGSAQTSSTLSEVINEAKKYQPIGRISIKLDNNLTLLKKSEFNLTLKDKDTLYVPSQIDTVTVFGEVFNPTSFVYDKDKSVNEYIAMASGLSKAADEDNIYVIHADGTSAPLKSGWFSTATKIQKGDTIVVPVYVKETSQLQVWDSISKILASFALTAAAVHTLGVL